MATPDCDIKPGTWKPRGPWLGQPRNMLNVSPPGAFEKTRLHMLGEAATFSTGASTDHLHPMLIDLV